GDPTGACGRNLGMEANMKKTLSRRSFLEATVKTAAVTTGFVLNGVPSAGTTAAEETQAPNPSDRIVDIHTHFEPENPKYIDEFLRMSDRLNVVGCMLTPFANRKVVAEAAKKYSKQIVPFGYLEMDAPDATKQVEEFHELGYRGLGE